MADGAAERSEDWTRDLSGARPVEQRVAATLRRHPEVRRFSDFTEETELDFEFEFERLPVRLDVKEKRSVLSDDYAELRPDVDRRDLFILDETAFRKLVWSEGMGYLLIHDRPGRSWHVFGPWELCLGPRRRFERRGDRGTGEFLKGKLLIDLRSAAATTPTLDVGLLLEVVRRSRNALERVGSVPLRTDLDLPVIPPRARMPAPPPAPALSPLGNIVRQSRVSPRRAYSTTTIGGGSARSWFTTSGAGSVGGG